ncbi:PH domain-containing protein [uncultured Sphingomonas sp.]|uniref:PH domain-containing protein n=1 Tax=uncultured Sphingomonas sp. TaxID=158754 RepID=UPI0025F899A2|nr:PH domain-containing protein [uncultured Sphingomonas sp.]
MARRVRDNGPGEQMQEPISQRTPPTLLLRGTFSQKLRIYLFCYCTAVIAATVVGILVLPIWLVIGPYWVKRYHAALRCEVTDRNVVIGKGLLFRRELTIPLDKIQDISIREGPLLSAFGLLQLRIETAGQSSSTGSKSDADLVGLLDARALRDRILDQRDALAVPAAVPVDSDRQVMVDMRDALLRIEALLAAR